MEKDIKEIERFWSYTKRRWPSSMACLEKLSTCISKKPNSATTIAVIISILQYLTRFIS